MKHKNPEGFTTEELEKRIYALLGLSMRAGYLNSGEFMTEQSVKLGKAKAVLVAADASANTKKQFRDCCTFYQIPLYVFGEKETLGNAIGKGLRASLSVCNAGMAKEVSGLLDIWSERQGSGAEK